MTNEIFCGNRHNLGFSIFGHIKLDFMELFQVRAFLNLEYHLFQVIWLYLTINYINSLQK